MNRSTLFLVICISFFSGCIKRSAQQARLVIKKSKTEIELFSKQLKPESRQKRMTIWIHGTKLVPRGFLDSFFSCPDGLTKAKELSTNYHMRTIAESISKTAPALFPLDSFFLFGWSGKLSPEAREQAAQQLALELAKSIKECKQVDGDVPYITIIAHSHGGNVALLLENYKHILPPQTTINQLILLGCPIQCTTASHAQSSLFTKIYNFYSSMDTIQLIDPQGIYGGTYKRPLFSDRYLKEDPKISQIQIKINGRGIMHVEFILPNFLTLLPFILQVSKTWKYEAFSGARYHLLHLKVT